MHVRQASWELGSGSDSFLSKTLRVTLGLGLVALMPTLSAQAQVAITLGVQETYDDNVFLENDRRQPAPFVVNDAIEEDIQDGKLSILQTKENDGKTDDDLITNVFLAMSSDIPGIERYAEGVIEGKVGFLTFADTDNQDRLTLDGTLRFDSARTFIPDPFYLSLFSTLTSQSNDSSVAQGTATRASEALDVGTNLGIRGWEILPRTTYGLGYAGSYHHFIGELLFDEPEIDRFEEQGSDYHTHMGVTSLDYRVTEAWTVGLTGQAGVQLFTDVEGVEQSSGTEFDPEDLDRTNADARVVTRYQVAERVTFGASGGIAYSKYHEDREPFEVITIDENGQSVSSLVQPEDDETSFVFNVDANWVYMPGSVASLGAMQNFGTNQNGERLQNRAFFANVTQAVYDRLSLSGNATFYQFSSDDDLSNSVDRLELGTSLTYSITQYTALTIGYNFIDQNADDSGLEDRFLFRSDDYQVNRAFVALNVGLVGLPL